MTHRTGGQADLSSDPPDGKALGDKRLQALSIYAAAAGMAVGMHRAQLVLLDPITHSRFVEPHVASDFTEGHPLS